MGWASTNSSTGAAAKTIDAPSTGPMNPLDSLGITPIPAEDEALRPQVRAFVAQAIKDLPPHRRARSWGGHDAALSRAPGPGGRLGSTLPRAKGGAGRRG